MKANTYAFLHFFHRHFPMVIFCYKIRQTLLVVVSQTILPEVIFATFSFTQRSKLYVASFILQTCMIEFKRKSGSWMSLSHRFIVKLKKEIKNMVKTTSGRIVCETTTSNV